VGSPSGTCIPLPLVTASSLLTTGVVGATANAEDFTVATMVADTAELIETLDKCPVRLVAVSMGSYIAQELMLARPELVARLR
jgi:pimeloyl-ACP methyl ester carboxylesterase